MSRDLLALVAELDGLVSQPDLAGDAATIVALQIDILRDLVERLQRLERDAHSHHLHRRGVDAREFLSLPPEDHL